MTNKIIRNLGGFWIIIILLIGIFLSFWILRDYLAWVSYYKVSPYISFFLNNSDPELFKRVGNFYFNGGAYNLDIAERSYKKALSLDPKIQGLNFQLSRIYFLRGDFEKALRLVNEELRIYPYFKRSHYLRALIYAYKGEHNRAEEEFIEFLKWYPKSWAANNDLAWVYFLQNRFEEAEARAREGLKWNPKNPWLLSTLGAALINLNKKEEAKEALILALSEAEKLTVEDWGRAYPGNDPRTYEIGLNSMKNTIRKNISIASK